MKYKASKITPPHKVPERLNTVVKSNALIQQSRFSLSTIQQKIILYIISQIEPWDVELKEYDFKVIDFCKVCGIEAHGEMYSIIKKHIKDICKITGLVYSYHVVNLVSQQQLQYIVFGLYYSILIKLV